MSRINAVLKVYKDKCRYATWSSGAFRILLKVGHDIEAARAPTRDAEGIAYRGTEDFEHGDAEGVDAGEEWSWKQPERIFSSCRRWADHCRSTSAVY